MQPNVFLMNAMLVFLMVFIAVFICVLLLVIRDGLADWKRRRTAKKIKPKTPEPRNNHD